VADPPLDDRSPLAIAAAWSATIITISMEMVLPIGLGYLVDTWLGTRIVFVILGAVAGMTLGMWHLMQVVSKSSSPGKGPGSKRPPPTDGTP
jgi:F0F1-type ATP synthase assembly protein I